MLPIAPHSMVPANGAKAAVEQNFSKCLAFTVDIAAGAGAATDLNPLSPDALRLLSRSRALSSSAVLPSALLTAPDLLVVACRSCARAEQILFLFLPLPNRDLPSSSRWHREKVRSSQASSCTATAVHLRCLCVAVPHTRTLRHVQREERCYNVLCLWADGPRLTGTSTLWHPL